MMENTSEILEPRFLTNVEKGLILGQFTGETRHMLRVHFLAEDLQRSKLVKLEAELTEEIELRVVVVELAAELEVKLEIESKRRSKAVSERDRANEVCDRASAREAKLEWKPIPEGSLEIDGIRFLLGTPDKVGDKKGVQAAGYWSEKHKFWAWPYDRPPTHYMELTKVE